MELPFFLLTPVARQPSVGRASRISHYRYLKLNEAVLVSVRVRVYFVARPRARVMRDDITSLSSTTATATATATANTKRQRKKTQSAYHGLGRRRTRRDQCRDLDILDLFERIRKVEGAERMKSFERPKKKCRNVKSIQRYHAVATEHMK